MFSYHENYHEKKGEESFAPHKSSYFMIIIANMMIKMMLKIILTMMPIYAVLPYFLSESHNDRPAKSVINVYLYLRLCHCICIFVFVFAFVCVFLR